jgi:heme/copper-type cytochrome/quinol oxidase subunit 2
MRLVTLLFILFLSISFSSNPSLADTNVPEVSADGKYYLQIVMYQWQFDVYNPKENESIEEAIRDDNPIASSGPGSVIGPFQVSTEIVFEVYSKDVQHGFQIEALGIALATVRPEPGDTLGDKRSAATILPSEPTVLQANCHIFCGLGHPDEVMDFQVDDIKVEDIDDTENLTLSVYFFPIIMTLVFATYFTNRRTK